jgi:3-mercaptopyruvate sulfurtransferase SseA
MIPRLLVPILAGALLLGAAQPAAPPEYPVKFIKVDDLKAQLDQGEKVGIYDVRTPDAYAELHIKGARNLPLRQVEARAPKEVPKNGRVVLY